MFTANAYYGIVFRYIEEHVLKTGVAIETQGFAFVTSGKKRESLTVSPTDINNTIKVLQCRVVNNN